MMATTQPTVDDILVLWGNWRAVRSPHHPTAAPRIEIRGFNGEWRWPDCSYLCPYCQQCLGCLRTQIYDEEPIAYHWQGDATEAPRFPTINTYAATCPQSPTWLPDVTESDETADEPGKFGG
jgi:hypothetical protein